VDKAAHATDIPAMDRRTFLMLTGAASAQFAGPRARSRAPGAVAAGFPGRLRFELDERRRWSLWYEDEDERVALVQLAEVVAWVGDQPVTLAQLEDSTVGNRRPPDGEAVVVHGRAAGIWIEAEFLARRDTPAPQATISVTLFPDLYLPSVRGVRFLRSPAAGLMPGGEPLVALLNGYGSRDPCPLVSVGGTLGDAGLASHGALGLARGPHGLALAFDAGEPGEARVTFGAEGIEAVSDWLPARPLRPEGDTSRLHVAYAPAGDGLDALRAVFAPASPVDRERLAEAVAPAGWRSRPAGAAPLSAEAVLAAVGFCAAHFDRRFFRYIQVDDGYQRAAGDWETGERFPAGHRALTERIHAAGFKAALWLAPLAVAEASGVPAAHPEWLLRDADGPVLCDTREGWGGRVYALDGAHPKVQQWLAELGRRVVRDWGYDAVTLDHLDWATRGSVHFGGLTHAEAYRAALGALRDGLGAEATLLAVGAPLQHAAGLVNTMGIGPEAAPAWDAVRAAARAAARRSFYHRAAWLNDPGGVTVAPPLSPGEAQAWASLVALTGGVTLVAGDLAALEPPRLAALARLFPAAPVAGRPVAAMAASGAAAGADDPPLAWVVEGAPRWWTVALVNWGDAPRDVSLPLAALGITGTAFAAYEVWGDVPLADLRDTLAATLAPRSALVVGIRAAVARPQVVGTTRHVVQGCVDVADETWNGATRTLAATAANLDGRRYAVTIAVPEGLRPVGCTADVPCTLRRLPSGHVVLAWLAGAAGNDGRDIRWKVRFALEGRRRARGLSSGAGA
jgi:hypothetical protein